jgi:hypothetical protein
MWFDMLGCLCSLYHAGFVNDAPHSLDFITNGDFARGGFGDWAVGMGVLKVFFNNETRPSLSVPLNLDNTIVTDNGCVEATNHNCARPTCCCGCVWAPVGAWHPVLA